MENGRKEITVKFSKVLREKLTERFGDMPSAARVANHFNLRAHGTGPITTEAARRWIKGLSVPELARFRVLNEWLGINTSDFISAERSENSGDTAGAPSHPNLIGKVDDEAALLNYVITKNELGEAQEKNFLRLFNLLNANEKDGILIAVWALLRVQQNTVRDE